MTSFAVLTASAPARTPLVTVRLPAPFLVSEPVPVSVPVQVAFVAWSKVRAQVQVPGGGNSPVVTEIVSGIVAAAHPVVDVGGCAGVHDQIQTQRSAARRPAENEVLDVHRAAVDGDAAADAVDGVVEESPP